MKTRKLLLLVAGFMLVALTAQAQFQSPAASYGYTLYNYVYWQSPSGSLQGIPIAYRLTGDYYNSDGSRSSYTYGQPTMSAGYSDGNSGTVYGVGEAYLEMRIADHYELRVSRSYMESCVNHSFNTGYPSYLNVTINLQRSGNYWTIRVYTDNIMK